MSWLNKHIEVVPLALNIIILGLYIYRWDEPGKMLYWLGASILTSGLLLMKG